MSMGRDYWKKAPTDVFGSPRGGGRRHRGVDTSHSTTSGTIEVPALTGGVVVGILAPASWHGFGHQVTIRQALGDGNQWDISHAHLHARTPLKMGQKVKQFEVVGLEGRTGATTGSCCHTEQQRVGGGFIDPLPEIKRVAAGTSYGAPAPAGKPTTPGLVPYSDHDKWVQEALNQLGYNLVVDGRRGTATILAIKNYQGKRKLQVDGIPGPKTTERLHADLAKPATAPGGLNYLKGWDWSGIQKMLRALYGYTSAIDNTPGAGTWKAMQAFLRYYGYEGPIDGKPGSGTLAAFARWLRSKWGYIGNDVPGPVMKAAFARASAANGKVY